MFLFTHLHFCYTSLLKRLQISNFISEAPNFFESFFNFVFCNSLCLFSIFNTSLSKRLQMSNFISEAPNFFESFFNFVLLAFFFPVFHLSTPLFRSGCKGTPIIPFCKLFSFFLAFFSILFSIVLYKLFYYRLLSFFIFGTKF